MNNVEQTEKKCCFVLDFIIKRISKNYNRFKKGQKIAKVLANIHLAIGDQDWWFHNSSHKFYLLTDRYLSHSTE